MRNRMITKIEDVSTDPTERKNQEKCSPMLEVSSISAIALLFLPRPRKNSNKTAKSIDFAWFQFAKIYK